MIDLRFVVPVLIQLRLICYSETAFTSIARKVLILPTVYMALTNTQRGHFAGIGPVGFVWAVTLFVACLKSIDLGFTPRSKIRYVGPCRQREQASIQDIERDLGWRGFFELLTNLRGIGWEWGSTLDTLPPVYRKRFGRRNLLEALKHQFISTISVAMLTYAMDNDDSLAQALGYERTRLTEYISDLVQTTALAVAAWSGLSLGYHWLAFTVYACSRLTRQEFNVERWPALLDDPLQMSSVHDFWTNKWHVIFKRQFVMCGYKPVVAVCNRVGIKGDFARLLGVQGAFLVSAIMHEYGIRNALNNVSHPDTYPSLIFFQLSALAIALELSFERVSGRKVGGTLGRTWAWAFLLVTGVPMMRHWMHGGRLGYIAPPRLWTIRRLLTPFGFMTRAS